MEPNPGSSL